MFNGHIAVFGQTGTGKSTLVDAFAGQYRRAGFEVCAYDPMFTIKQVDWRTSDIEEFLNRMLNSQNCFGVVDEGTKAIDWTRAKYIWLGTTSRHWGHRMIFAGNRPHSIPVDIRSQCGKIFVFNLQEEDAKNAAAMSDIPWRAIKGLKPFEFFQWERHVGVKKQKLKV